MNMPGFTAERSFYEASDRYHAMESPTQAGRLLRLAYTLFQMALSPETGPQEYRRCGSLNVGSSASHGTGDRAVSSEIGRCFALNAGRKCIASTGA
jgi:hypothetical protein